MPPPREKLPVKFMVAAGAYSRRPYTRRSYYLKLPVQVGGIGR